MSGSRPTCKYEGCIVTSPKRMNADGYCDKHANIAAEEATVESRLTALEEENATLKQELLAHQRLIIELYKLNNDVRKAVNGNNYSNDGLEQYGRRESFRIIDLAELPLKYDNAGNVIDNEDCKATAVEAAELLGVNITRNDVQRAHRIGRRRVPTAKNPNPKARQLIVRLKDYDNRCKIISKKKHLQENANENGKNRYADSFITEDLAPNRSTLLWYMKKRCDGKFQKCHTIEGRIKATVKDQQGKDQWITVSNPDELFEHYDDIDIDALNKKNRKYQILKTVEIPVFDHSGLTDESPNADDA